MKINPLLFFAVLLAVAADAQDVLTVSKDTRKITAEQAGSYDFIKDEWKLQAGNTYLLCMPAALDGYYFGPGAEKKEVVKFEETDKDLHTYSITVKDMADLDDFKPNVTYLVTMVDDEEEIRHITPGIKTEAVVTPENTELQNAWVSPFSNIATGINSIMEDGDANKPVAIYDIEGRSVKSIHKGAMYIINGKKVTIK